MMKYMGSMRDHELPLKQKDVVTIKKGTLVLHRGEWKPAGRTYKVKIHHFSAIWITQAAKVSPYPASWPELSAPDQSIGVLSPSVCFPGSGGYWSDVNLNDIPEAAYCGTCDKPHVSGTYYNHNFVRKETNG